MIQLALIQESWIMNPDQGKEAYREDRELILKWAGEAITPEILKAYMKLIDERASAQTYNRRISACRDWIRAYFRDLKPSEKYQLNEQLEVDFQRKRIQKTGVDPSRIVTEEEIKKLIDASSTRNGLVIETLYTSGLRISELTGARLDHISDDGGACVRLTVLGKGRKERTVRLSRSLYNRIIETYNPHEYLFETESHHRMDRHYIGSAIRTTGWRVLQRRISPHTMRHSFATSRIQATGKIRGVADYLGHQSAQTTLDMYTHETLEDSELWLLDDSSVVAHTCS